MSTLLATIHDASGLGRISPAEVQNESGEREEVVERAGIAVCVTRVLARDTHLFFAVTRALVDTRSLLFNDCGA